MITSIILAGGNGTRINSTMVNKVALPFMGKPMVLYGVELLEKLSDKVIVVIGAYADSVKEALKGKNVGYAEQTERLGTAHAVKVAVESMATGNQNPSVVLVGYGDHLMFYKPETIEKMKRLHAEKNAAVTIITVRHSNPDQFAWGRIVRDSDGHVIDIIEQKDATEEERKIDEINPGFYCFDYAFLRDYIDKVEKSPVSGEYYLTDMIKIAVKNGLKVAGMEAPFNEVGIGVNSNDDLQKSSNLYKDVNAA